MVILDADHYIVYGFQIYDDALYFKDHVRRATVVTYPKVFRYKVIRYLDLVFVVNEYFSILCFQRIPGDTANEAKNSYENQGLFNRLYGEAVLFAGTRFNTTFIDADFCFMMHFDASMSVAWESCSINREDQAQLNVFIEACFLFQLLTEVRRKLPLITERRRSYVFQRTLVDQVEDLFWSETPTGYLVNQHEVSIMKVFYRAWCLDQSIMTLRERFGQSVSNHTFFADLIARERSQIVGLLLTAIAIFSAYGVRDVVVKNIPFISAKGYDVVFLLLFACLIVVALTMSAFIVGRRLFAWIRWWRASRILLLQQRKDWSV
jgi:hypothetical protein